jgi:hypothetical protein
MRKIEENKQKTWSPGAFSDIFGYVFEPVTLRMSNGGLTKEGNYSSADIRSGIRENDKNHINIKL